MPSEAQGRLRALFLFAAGPVPRGAKPASLITLPGGCAAAWRKAGPGLCRATGLRAALLNRMQGGVVLLVYDKTALRTTLKSAKAQTLLARHGYGARGLQSQLCRLKARFAQEEFPHEIGLFLGYPPEDVQSFIEQRGQNCLCCGHWKVYHNPEQARARFAQIDAARRLAAEVASQPVRRAVHILKTQPV